MYSELAKTWRISIVHKFTNVNWKAIQYYEAQQLNGLVQRNTSTTLSMCCNTFCNTCEHIVQKHFLPHLHYALRCSNSDMQYYVLPIYKPN